MSNELKFRYIYGIPGQPETYFARYFTIEDIENCCHYLDVPFGIFEKGYEIILRDQFTGLKDKNGKDSFDCDLCKFVYYIQNSANPDDLKKYTGTGRILMIDGCFMIEDLKTTHKTPLHYTDLSFEIIGNTHGVKEKN